MPDPKFIQIQTTTDNEANAQTIARYLVENHLAACVQIIQPVTSYYIWADKPTTSLEYLLLIKATLANYPAIVKVIQKLHNYQLPEIIATPIVAGQEDYLSWLAAACQTVK